MLEDYKVRYGKLVEYIRKLGKVAVACSGGVDSTALLLAASEAFLNDPEKVRGFMVFSCFEDEEMAEGDLKILRNIGTEISRISLNPLDSKDIRENREDRCYYCKKFIFSTILKEAEKMGEGVFLLEGSNADDDPGDRPGTRALSEMKILSPLRELGIGKADVRSILKEKNIENWDKPSQSCLATRIPHGHEISMEALSRVNGCEKVLKSLGFRQCRVRVAGSCASIEVLAEEISVLRKGDNPDMIRRGFGKFGIEKIEIKPDGFHPERRHEAVEYMR